MFSRFSGLAYGKFVLLSIVKRAADCCTLEDIKIFITALRRVFVLLPLLCDPTLIPLNPSLSSCVDTSFASKGPASLVGTSPSRVLPCSPLLNVREEAVFSVSWAIPFHTKGEDSVLVVATGRSVG